MTASEWQVQRYFDLLRICFSSFRHFSINLHCLLETTSFVQGGLITTVSENQTQQFLKAYSFLVLWLFVLLVFCYLTYFAFWFLDFLPMPYWVFGLDLADTGVETLLI